MKLITIKITHVDQCDFEHKMSIQKASCQSKNGQKMSDDVFLKSTLILIVYISSSKIVLTA
jgi:hypothetical protein